MRELFPQCWEHRLSSGLRVLLAPLEHARSVALGIWARVGGRHDPPGKEGLAHLVEHMVFKGTTQRSALELAQAMDALGGYLNGSTSREATSYYTVALDEGLSTSLEVLTEMVTSPRFAPHDLARERGVVLEEIRGAEDEPEDLVFESLAGQLWGRDHPLGRPVLGHRDTVATLEEEDLWACFREGYRAGRSVLVASGRFELEPLLDRLEHIPWNGDPAAMPKTHPPEPGSGPVVLERDIQQVHLALAFPTVPASSPDRAAYEVLSSLLGGGVSSRLFQRVREERGLLYTVFSTTSYYSDAGALTVYAAAEEERLAQALALIWGELRDMAQRVPDEAELARSISRLKSSFLIGQETATGRMARLGSAAALGLPILSVEEVLQRLESVTGEQVRSLASACFRPERAAVALVGRSGERLVRTLLSGVEVTP